ncbi:cell wall protein DAN4-like [Acyrthosiphon pisum]|uniref:Uncharacterized protein n=1 Tax=Acyrthosiphon pisum TaxID=7029 RepID=A0A8R2H813_ACYPI|nr:cell wall protein DAN4-like [Acyrthosiphon pisum]|eukprot:XP_016658158.1 PREDICTED: cell wall protein DAN4-like [Acyrthosiphon pisum]
MAKCIALTKPICFTEEDMPRLRIQQHQEIMTNLIQSITQPLRTTPLSPSFNKKPPTTSIITEQTITTTLMDTTQIQQHQETISNSTQSITQPLKTTPLNPSFKKKPSTTSTISEQTITTTTIDTTTTTTTDTNQGTPTTTTTTYEPHSQTSPTATDMTPPTTIPHPVNTTDVKIRNKLRK